MPFIVDASLAFKWFVPEPASEQALSLLDLQTELVAPDLLLIEVVNALWARLRGRDGYERIVTEAAAALPQMIDVRSVARELTPRALEMTVSLNHPLYDCIYLALAEQERGQLITADLNFFRKVEASSFSALMLDWSMVVE